MQCSNLSGGESKFQQTFHSPKPLSTLHHGGQRFHEVFQIKHGRYADIPAAKISEMMKSNSLDNAPTQSLLSVVNGILEESVERKNGEIPHRVASLLRKVVQEIERRISAQAEHLRTQNSLFKAREEKYQSRIRVLEALATGTSEESQIVTNQLQQIKHEKNKIEEQKKIEGQDMLSCLAEEKEKFNVEISILKQELEKAKKELGDYLETESMLKQELEKVKKQLGDYLEMESTLKQELEKAKKELGDYLETESTLKQELAMAKKDLGQYLEMESKASGTKVEIENRLKELNGQLELSRNKVKELEASSKSNNQIWSKKEHKYVIFIDSQAGAIRELRLISDSIKHETLEARRNYAEDFIRLGGKLEAMSDAVANYHEVLVENRKLFNELQELKGNIRVYCRIRPFLPGQSSNYSTVNSIKENGELVISNPSKQGKDGLRLFRFNKVFGPTSTQAEVFSDIQPLIRSVLDGYNACIFAYGQTGSGKTHTMMGPTDATKEDWGVNYRALNDLFRISQARKNSFGCDISVQMVEIYNEQVRDLLSGDNNQKRLGIKTSTQASGLAVPDASTHPVNATEDVLQLMNVGLNNRAMAGTALNERSSRSHSIVSVHVAGKDLKTGTAFHGSLHLVDLAGSERIDRSEVTGERLKETQHINKSLSALGDVISALAQKNSHVPYRNSKLTQLLQSSLGGHAKTLMFVQLNPDAVSYSETMSTLKFAERASGVELGAARSSKDGKDAKELMDQIASLKEMISRKDNEIEWLQSERQGALLSGTNSDSGSPQSVENPENSERMEETVDSGSAEMKNGTSEKGSSKAPRRSRAAARWARVQNGQQPPGDEFMKVVKSLRKTTPGGSSPKTPKRWQ